MARAHRRPGDRSATLLNRQLHMDAINSHFAAWANSYGTDFKRSLDLLVRDNYRAIEADVTIGVLRPHALSQSGRRHLLRYLRDLGVQLAGLGAEFEGTGLADPSHADARLAELADIVRMARELNVPRVHTRLGGAPEPMTTQLLHELAGIAGRSGVTLVVHGKPAALLAPLRSLACDDLNLGLDTGESIDAAADVTSAQDAVGGVFLRDVRRHAHGVEQVAFGAGESDFAALLAAVEQSGYRGPLTLRWDGPDGAGALRRGLEYFRSLRGDSR